MPTNAPQLVVRCLMMSIDGFAAGLNQRLEQPFGDATEGFTDWMFETPSGRKMLGLDGGAVDADNPDDPYVAHSFDNVGAVILVATCSLHLVVRGPTTVGPAGGVTIRRTTHPRSSSPTTSTSRFRWRVVRRFILRPTGSTTH